MKTKCFCMGICATNCYVVSDDFGKCVVIDPCDLGDKIYSYIKSVGAELCAVLLTHAHYDHIFGLDDLLESARRDGKENIGVYIHEDDRAAMKDPDANVSGSLFGRPYMFSGETTAVGNGDRLVFGKLAFSVLHTPGHTKGSACYICENIVFSGDTMFCSSCGRTDLPGGSYEDMKSSLEKLYNLPETYSVYPGHGEMTAIGDEKAVKLY